MYCSNKLHNNKMQISAAEAGVSNRAETLVLDNVTSCNLPDGLGLVGVIRSPWLTSYGVADVVMVEFSLTSDVVDDTFILVPGLTSDVVGNAVGSNISINKDNR